MQCNQQSGLAVGLRSGWKRLAGFLALAFVLASSSATPALAAETVQLKAAFVRDGAIWINNGGQEKQISQGGRAYEPVWSFDGNWLAFLKEVPGKEGEGGEVWVYSAASGKLVRVLQEGGANLQWSPKQDILGFQAGTVLNVSDPAAWTQQLFNNVTVGVGNYAWLPDGSGFLVSSLATSLPIGWTDIQLFRVPLTAGMDKSKITHFYTIPSEAKDFFAVSTGKFHYSPDARWIAFLAKPTASLSADGNTLCLLSADGHRFQRAAQMLAYEQWIRWAPSGSLLAYIEGTGRTASQNKHLTVRTALDGPDTALTPSGYADGDFAWESDEAIAVSRAKESGPDTASAKRPLPSLMLTAPKERTAKQITQPPARFGDYAPQYLAGAGRLAWIRHEREAKKADAWIAAPDGKQAKAWISGIDAPPKYYGEADWTQRIAWYSPLRRS